MNDEPLERLAPHESREVWDRFTSAFNFRPSMHVFPAITEPADSITWSLDALDDDPGYRKLDRLVDVVEGALASCVPPGATLLILEWQHTSYRLRPDLPLTDTRPGWPRSPYPDGDYPILIAEDLQFGSFGHPWEHSLCLFGAQLLELATAEVDSILERVLRRGGQTIRTT